MYELSASQAHLVRPLFTAFDHHLGPLAVLNGLLSGAILVDDPLQPRAALTWLKHRIYLAGTPDGSFLESARRLLHENILPAAQAARRERYLVYYPDSAAAQAAALLDGLEFTREWRLALELRELLVDWRPLLPPKMLLQRIDAGLLRQPGLVGKDSITLALTAEHPSLEDALRHEFGYCLIRRRLVLARCLSEYAGGQRCEIGIVTHPEFRRQGLATIAACATIEHALFRGITRIGWHCWEKNRASSALARKLGFQLQARYPVLTGRIASPASG